MLDKFSPKLICIKGSINIVADAVFCLNKIDNLNYRVEPTLNSHSENFAQNDKDVLHLTSYETIMRLQHHDKSMIEIAKEKPNDYFIKLFHRTGEIYSLFCRCR